MPPLSLPRIDVKSWPIVQEVQLVNVCPRIATTTRRPTEDSCLVNTWICSMRSRSRIGHEFQFFNHENKKIFKEKKGAETQATKLMMEREANEDVRVREF